MKKIFMLVFILILLSLACQAVLPPAPGGTVAVSASPPATLRLTGTTSSVVPTEAASPAPEAVATAVIPTVEPITCSDDSCLNACLDRINQALPQDVIEPIGGAYANGEIDLNLVYYDVKDGQLGEPQDLYVPSEFKSQQQDTAAHLRVWKYASAMLPLEQLKWIVKYEIFSSSYYAAWVSSNDTDRSRWTLGVDIEDAQDPLVLTIVLVHEFGHMITLNTDQIPTNDYFYYTWNQNPAFCPQFLTPDGCAKPDSYINLFYQTFWTKIFDEWYEMVSKPQVKSSEERRALVHDFYQLHPEQFIREYAATNVFEDVAESFQHFVLEPKPTGNSIVDRKIRFYYDFPELVTLRQQMIQNVCAYVQ
jgi:hypothetical protein